MKTTRKRRSAKTSKKCALIFKMYIFQFFSSYFRQYLIFGVGMSVVSFIRIFFFFFSSWKNSSWCVDWRNNIIFAAKINLSASIEAERKKFSKIQIKNVSERYGNCCWNKKVAFFLLLPMHMALYDWHRDKICCRRKTSRKKSRCMPKNRWFHIIGAFSSTIFVFRAICHSKRW